MILLRYVTVLFVSVALLGAVVAAAASLTVGGVNELGSGESSVVAPASDSDEEVKVTDVEWALDLGDSSKVFSLRVTFAPITNTNFDAVHLVLKGSSGVLQQKTFPNQDIDGTTFDANKIVWTLSPLVSAADINEFAITIVDGN